MDVSYNPGVPKVIKGVINNETGGTARVEDSVVGILGTWAVEVRGGIGSCVERGAVDGFVFAFRSLVNYTVVD